VLTRLGIEISKKTTVKLLSFYKSQPPRVSDVTKRSWSSAQWNRK